MRRSWINPALLIGSVTVLGFLTVGYFEVRRSPDPVVASGAASIGGPFQMVDQNSRPVSEASLLGRPTAIFFGFTFCPDVCPTTLSDLTRWMAALGQDADRLNVVFVSVDPERDTPELLKAYLSNFDPRIRGLRGTAAQTQAMVAAYKVYFQKVPLDGGGYTVDHSTGIYLFDAEGQFLRPIPYGVDDAEGLKALRGLVG